MPISILRLITLSVALLSTALWSVPARSAENGWVQAEHAELRLVAAVTGAGTRETIPLGLEFRLDPGWKIYWRTPGDAGLPPIPDWSDSDNVASVTMDWPVPKRFEIFDIGTLGYEDAVLFPLTVVPERVGDPLRVRGGIDFLICEEICIPGRAEVALDLPSGPATAAEHAHLIDRYRAIVPVSDPAGTGLRLYDARVAEGRDGVAQVALTVGTGAEDLSGLDAFVEGPGGAYFGKPNIEAGSKASRAVLKVNAPPRLDIAALTRDGITVTLVDGSAALETRIIPQRQAGTALWTILGLALLGGLILNLMPCVLPVLSLKLMSVLGKSGQNTTSVRIGFLAATAGIFTSFLVLAAGAVALKYAGLGVGWGIQFQQPVFLALMIALLTLFACNMAGVFEFRLPGRVADRAATAGTGRDGLLRDFLTGAFATLLATPCSAPFLGTAVGFALSAGAPEIFSVFMALATGLALPYLVIAAFPAIVRFLPKPGRWMAYLKAVLTLALIGTAIWLVSILATTVGTDNAIAVAALAAVAAAVLIARKIDGSRLGRMAWPVSTILAAAAVLSPLTFATQDITRPAAVSTQDGIQWRAFDEAAIPALVADGKTVLVDVTADWCVTCQWNKKTVLESESVSDWLARDDVIAMQADWTSPDPVIAEFLARHGRYGIPFNIVYGPNAPDGAALPELLTLNAVREAAAKANPAVALAATE